MFKRPICRTGHGLTLMLLAGASFPAWPAQADVTAVKVESKGHSRFTFHVTVAHPDEGWSHYVDRWEIRTLDNKLLAARTLRHPHVEQQPFSRSLHNIPLPDEIDRVIIKAHCSRDNYGGSTIEVELERQE